MMAKLAASPGLREIRAARHEMNGTLVAVIVFSVLVNLLMLTGPLYMLQVYDRVLQPIRSDAGCADRADHLPVHRHGVS